jgi:hypothetical protein
LAPLNGSAIYAIRYAWGNTHDSCCDNKADPLQGTCERQRVLQC